MRHEAILIDLVDFRHLNYDEGEDEVQASPSTLAVDLLTFLAKKQRFFPVGHYGDIGLGGYLLQGGIGLNSRGYGYVCEYITGFDIVTADGEIKDYDEKERSDLYWAARGAGPSDFVRAARLLTSLDEDVEVAMYGFVLPQLNQPGLVLNATAFGDSDEDVWGKLKQSSKLTPLEHFLPKISRPPTSPKITTWVKITRHAVLATSPTAS
ncbi:hypothetical protein AAE478_003652 [Parahypoxylon ruwenzoriense]